MKKFSFIFTLFIPALFAESQLIKTCTSPSGKSIYNISLNNKIDSVGQIVLRYDNQITFYSAITKRNNNNKLIGVSKFVRSETGQTEADPWVFTYDYEKNILIDDGRLTSPCN